jgi:hypothetical protein
MGGRKPTPFERLLLKQQPTDAVDPWKGSTFEWLKTAASRRKGAFGERLVKDAAAVAGLQVSKSSTTGAGTVLEGVAVEVKLSTVWSSGDLKFQQLRNQPYDVVVFVAVAPESVSMWAASKAVALAHSTGQHTGHAATETSWVSWPAGQAPKWATELSGPEDLAKYIRACQKH